MIYTVNIENLDATDNDFPFFNSSPSFTISMYSRVSQKFGIKVYWRLQFLEYLGTLSLKFQKARTKIEVVLSLPW